MPEYTPLNIPLLEKSYKKGTGLTFVILILIAVTLGVVALIGFVLIQKNSLL